MKLPGSLAPIVLSYCCPKRATTPHSSHCTLPSSCFSAFASASCTCSAHIASQHLQSYSTSARIAIPIPTHLQPAHRRSPPPLLVYLLGPHPFLRFRYSKPLAHLLYLLLDCKYGYSTCATTSSLLLPNPALPFEVYATPYPIGSGDLNLNRSCPFLYLFPRGRRSCHVPHLNREDWYACFSKHPQQKRSPVSCDISSSLDSLLSPSSPRRPRTQDLDLTSSRAIFLVPGFPVVSVLSSPPSAQFQTVFSD